MINSELFNNVLAFASILAVVILGLVQLIKNNTRLSRNVIPFVGLGIGLLVGAAAYPFTDLGMTLRLWAGGLPDCLLQDYLNWHSITAQGIR